MSGSRKHRKTDLVADKIAEPVYPAPTDSDIRRVTEDFVVAVVPCHGCRLDAQDAVS